jgi:hypothetical protein
MMKICYSRLINDIEQYSRLGNQIESSFNFQNQILLDAWSLVDTLNRLRILVSHTPGLKKNSLVVLFQKSTENIEILRNFIQHINREIPEVEDTGWPIWGSLTWIYVSPEMQAKKELKVMVIIPGHLAKSKGLPAVNPVGLSIEPPVDHISLTVVSNPTIDLSDLYRTTMQFEQRFETSMNRAKENQKNNNGKNEIIQILLVE